MMWLDFRIFPAPPNVIFRFNQPLDKYNAQFDDGPGHDGEEYHRQIANMRYDLLRPEANGDDGPNISVPGSSRA
jgi:hypothetical protein